MPPGASIQASIFTATHFGNLKMPSTPCETAALQNITVARITVMSMFRVRLPMALFLNYLLRTCAPFQGERFPMLTIAVNSLASWMQWLRHTRLDPPTIAEQQMDQERQERIKVLAARADARWAAKPSALDTPDRQQPVQMLQNRDPDRGVVQTDVSLRGREGTRAAGQQDSGRHKWAASESARTEGEVRKEDVKHSPWDTAHQSQEWQPTGWNPAPAKRSA